METENLLLHLQEPATCPYPEPDQSTPCPTSHFLNIHLHINEKYRSLSYFLCSFILFPVTSSLLGPNVFLSMLFLNILRLRSSLSVTDQISHSFITTGKIIILCILILIFLDRKLKDKRFCTELQQAFCDFSFPEYNFNLLSLFPNI